MQERWRELLSQLSAELEQQSTKLRDLEYQNRQLLDTGMDSNLVHVCAASMCFLQIVSCLNIFPFLASWQISKLVFRSVDTSMKSELLKRWHL